MGREPSISLIRTRLKEPAKRDIKSIIHAILSAGSNSSLAALAAMPQISSFGVIVPTSFSPQTALLDRSFKMHQTPFFSSKLQKVSDHTVSNVPQLTFKERHATPRFLLCLRSVLRMPRNYRNPANSVDNSTENSLTSGTIAKRGDPITYST